MTVRIRGIYATALTALLDDVVLPSDPIADRFDDGLAHEPARATVETTGDRQGVVIAGESDRVADVDTTLTDLGLDALSWAAALGRSGVYAGRVTDTLGGGAVVDCGAGEGYLPYDRTARHVSEGDALRVQVTDPRPPWRGKRPGLDTTVRIPGSLVSLVRGGERQRGSQPAFTDIVPGEPPAGWGVRWHAAEDDAVGLAALGDALAAATDRARAVDDALADAAPPGERDPGPYWPGEATRFVWFGRETRFSLDDQRRRVTATMPGHHRIKVGTDAASAAVDFVEAVCDSPGGDALPFGALTRQFGPRAGETVRLDHGKPEGERIVLGRASVTDVDADGTVTLRREMSPGGTYDGLGVERRAGDVAVTKVREGRWWYPTVYRSDAGDRRGTYVNVCTPVEILPDAVRYVDLHVDVLKHADGSVERVDDDELDEAVDAGHVSEALAEKARRVARGVESAL